MRWNGRIYEALMAGREHRPARPIYHSALEVVTAHGTFVIEMAPVWSGPTADRGVVREGPVGAHFLGRFQAFRYEVRCWHDGAIPDLAEAVQSPQLVSSDASRADAVLDVVRTVPALTWGRDELGAGEMWNSNSVVAWLLACTGHDMNAIQPPEGGRAPGWGAGLILAARRTDSAHAYQLSAISTR